MMLQVQIEQKEQKRINKQENSINPPQQRGINDIGRPILDENTLFNNIRKIHKG